MISSMTGFARREASGPFGSLVCELRSVNHRFLESSFRLPEELRAAESELRQALLRELKRGKVDCTFTYRSAHEGEIALNLDTAALERVLAWVRELATALPERHTINLLDVLRWPGVIRDESPAGEELIAAARDLFAATVAELAATRAREGVRLRELIEQRCNTLESLVAQVRARMPEVQARIRVRLNERLAE